MLTPSQRHAACNGLSLARKAHLGLARKDAERVLQSGYAYYQRFSDTDIAAMCQAQNISIAGPTRRILFRGTEYLYYVARDELYRLKDSGLPNAGAVRILVKNGSFVHQQVLAAMANLESEAD